MIFTDYYRFERVAKISMHRMDCVASTESYPTFEQLRKTKAQRKTEKVDGVSVGDLILYWGKPDKFVKAPASRSADRAFNV